MKRISLMRSYTVKDKKMMFPSLLNILKMVFCFIFYCVLSHLFSSAAVVVSRCRYVVMSRRHLVRTIPTSVCLLIVPIVHT